MSACTKSCRFPGGTVERIEQAADENDLLVSELLRRAVRYYIQMNPDEFGAFAQASEPNVVNIDPKKLVDSDAIESPVDSKAESDSSGGDSVPSGGVYDPMEEN